MTDETTDPALTDTPMFESTPIDDTDRLTALEQRVSELELAVSAVSSAADPEDGDQADEDAPAGEVVLRQ